MKVTPMKTVSTNSSRKEKIKQVRKRNPFLSGKDQSTITETILQNALMEVKILFLSIATESFLHMHEENL